MTVPKAEVAQHKPHRALINRISALTKLFSATPDKRNKYVHKIISVKKPQK
jgi:hypothetical protein